MAEGEVYVVDRVVTRAGRGREFVDAYLSGYAPGATVRGMTLRDVLVSPPIWSADQTNTVTITWSLPSAQAWWEMTWQGRPDPERPVVGRASANSWSSATRSVAAAASDVDGLCDV